MCPQKPFCYSLQVHPHLSSGSRRCRILPQAVTLAACSSGVTCSGGEYCILEGCSLSAGSTHQLGCDIVQRGFNEFSILSCTSLQWPEDSLLTFLSFCCHFPISAVEPERQQQACYRSGDLLYVMVEFQIITCYFFEVMISVNAPGK